MAGAWHGISLVGLHAASQTPGTPWLGLCSQAQPITRESDHELEELVVSWTVPCSIAAEPAAHRLIPYLLKGPAPVTEFAAAACVWGTLLGVGSWGRWRDFLQQVFLI